MSAATPPCARKFAEPELEDAFHAGGFAARFDRSVQRAEVAAGPETILEAVGIAAGAIDDIALAENDGPGADRSDQQQREDDLHHQARLHDQPDNRKFTAHSPLLWLCP